MPPNTLASYFSGVAQTFLFCKRSALCQTSSSQLSTYHQDFKLLYNSPLCSISNPYRIYETISLHNRDSSATLQIDDCGKHL